MRVNHTGEGSAMFWFHLLLSGQEGKYVVRYAATLRQWPGTSAEGNCILASLLHEFMVAAESRTWNMPS